MSSSKSIRNEDYTSMDFLQKLISASQTPSDHSIKKIPSISQNSNGHSLKQFDDCSNIQQAYIQSPIRITRTHSLLETQPKQYKNFKVFYKAIVDGVYGSQQSENIWKKFESCADHPIELDKFIQDFNNKKQKIKQEYKNKTMMIKQVQTINQLNIDVLFYKRNRSNSESPRKYTINKNKSLPKRLIPEATKSKEGIRKQIEYIRKVIQHGEKFIHS